MTMTFQELAERERRAEEHETTSVILDLASYERLTAAGEEFWEMSRLANKAIDQRDEARAKAEQYRYKYHEAMATSFGLVSQVVDLQEQLAVEVAQREAAEETVEQLCVVSSNALTEVREELAAEIALNDVLDEELCALDEAIEVKDAALMAIQGALPGIIEVLGAAAEKLTALEHENEVLRGELMTLELAAEEEAPVYVAADFGDTEASVVALFVSDDGVWKQLRDEWECSITGRCTTPAFGEQTVFGPGCSTKREIDAVNADYKARRARLGLHSDPDAILSHPQDDPHGIRKTVMDWRTSRRAADLLNDGAFRPTW